MFGASFGNIGYPLISQKCENSLTISHSSPHFIGIVSYDRNTRKMCFDSEISEKFGKIDIKVTENTREIGFSPNIFGVYPTVGFILDSTKISSFNIEETKYKIEVPFKKGGFKFYFSDLYESKSHNLVINLKNKNNFYGVNFVEKLTLKPYLSASLLAFNEIFSAFIKVGSEKLFKAKSDFTYKQFTVFYEYATKYKETQRNKIGLVCDFENDLFGIKYNIKKSYAEMKMESIIPNGKVCFALKADKNKNIYTSVGSKLHIKESKLAANIRSNGAVFAGLKMNICQSGTILLTAEKNILKGKPLCYAIDLSFDH